MSHIGLEELKMDAGGEVKFNSDTDLYEQAKLELDFFEFLKINGDSIEDLKLEKYEGSSDEEEEEEENGESEEEFSFMSGGEHAQPITAEEAFNGGQIKTVFPLFNRNLLFAGGSDTDTDSDSLRENLPMRPPVKKVFVETNESSSQTTSSAAGNDGEIAGPYCEWSSRKAVEASPPTEACKKSSSTGFSKIWRFREYRERSHSDGRDAFVFLHAPPKKQAAVAAAEKTETAVKVKAKKSGKGKTASAHEVYLRSKAKDDRRRSYLPYRPELMGFFTSVNGGGLTRNVHPY